MKTQKRINMTLKVALLNFDFLQGTREQLLQGTKILNMFPQIFQCLKIILICASWL